MEKQTKHFLTAYWLHQDYTDDQGVHLELSLRVACSVRFENFATNLKSGVRCSNLLKKKSSVCWPSIRNRAQPELILKSSASCTTMASFIYILLLFLFSVKVSYSKEKLECRCRYPKVMVAGRILEGKKQNNFSWIFFWLGKKSITNLGVRLQSSKVLPWYATVWKKQKPSHIDVDLKATMRRQM